MFVFMRIHIDVHLKRVRENQVSFAFLKMFKSKRFFFSHPHPRLTPNTPNLLILQKLTSDLFSAVHLPSAWPVHGRPMEMFSTGKTAANRLALRSGFNPGSARNRSNFRLHFRDIFNSVKNQRFLPVFTFCVRRHPLKSIYFNHPSQGSSSSQTCDHYRCKLECVRGWGGPRSTSLSRFGLAVRR